MARLLDSYQVRLSTDFAILSAVQSQLQGVGVDTQTYAASAPGYPFEIHPDEVPRSLPA